jgi:hypothetical protein
VIEITEDVKMVVISHLSMVSHEDIPIKIDPIYAGALSQSIQNENHLEFGELHPEPA